MAGKFLGDVPYFGLIFLAIAPLGIARMKFSGSSWRSAVIIQAVLTVLGIVFSVLTGQGLI
ncbi:MAG: hypothetical protein FWD94_08090 [Treponema sp.]|nr:hypothetical protein [Treponema sp.]